MHLEMASSFARRGHAYALETPTERDHERERDRAPLSSAIVGSGHRQYADRLERDKTLSMLCPVHRIQYVLTLLSLP